MQKRQQHGETFWRDHCRRWEGSEISQADYCAANKLSLKTFCRWRGVFKRQGSVVGPGRQSRSTAPAFVPVHIAGGQDLTSALRQEDSRDVRLRIDGGQWVVHVRPGVDVGALVAALKAVELASR